MWSVFVHTLHPFSTKKMKRISLICLLFASLAATAKENLSDFYIVQPRENDKLFFVLPIEISEVSKKGKNATFDITHLTSSPTSTVNLSIYAQQHLDADSIVFSNSKEKIAVTDFKTFFIERDKQVWKHRYSCSVPFAKFYNLYKDSKPWKMTVYYAGGQLVYQQTSSVWERERVRMSEILYMIQLNSVKK